MSHSLDPENIKSVILSRKTEKVLGNLENAPVLSEQVLEKNRQIVLDALETAGWAPFHFPRNANGLAEPWRAHVLWQSETQRLAKYLKNDRKVASKEPLLCAGCNALVIVTWLPEFYTEAQRAGTRLKEEAQRTRDEEHLAATSAMIQNLLLLLTAHKMGNYWSSGGILRTPEILKKIGASAKERLLGAIFIEYPEAVDLSKDRKPGALRESRSQRWIREATLT
ncbi:MAG: nitroreductase family protein [Verrucomicrobiota bacterium]